MKEETIENDILRNDKIQLPKHNYITSHLLIKRKFINEDDIETFMYDALFEELLRQYDFKTIIIASSYIISKVKSQNFLDQDNNPVRSKYAYFRSSIIWDLKKLTGQVDMGWLDDDYGDSVSTF